MKQTPVTGPHQRFGSSGQTAGCRCLSLSGFFFRLPQESTRAFCGGIDQGRFTVAAVNRNKHVHPGAAAYIPGQTGYLFTGMDMPRIFLGIGREASFRNFSVRGGQLLSRCSSQTSFITSSATSSSTSGSPLLPGPEGVPPKLPRQHIFEDESPCCFPERSGGGGEMLRLLAAEISSGQRANEHQSVFLLPCLYKITSALAEIFFSFRFYRWSCPLQPLIWINCVI